jgi:hypothetical protein
MRSAANRPWPLSTCFLVVKSVGFGTALTPGKRIENKKANKP